nr:hypothetical protein Iba_scaffold150CG0300 [Ipomoea batatas]
MDSTLSELTHCLDCLFDLTIVNSPRTCLSSPSSNGSASIFDLLLNLLKFSTSFLLHAGEDSPFPLETELAFVLLDLNLVRQPPVSSSRSLDVEHGISNWSSSSSLFTPFTPPLLSTFFRLFGGGGDESSRTGAFRTLVLRLSSSSSPPALLDSTSSLLSIAL